MDSRKRERNLKTRGSQKSGFHHLKWPAIILGVLILALVILLDHCSRTDQI
ncbi:hypothetical protein [Salinimicrobium flavum]|uniref:Uncharacterized protein n=1 Tax=Salinimicrobium flavum TaxID=1737065 RepID=A0ABW5IVJ6_9FLAO